MDLKDVIALFVLVVLVMADCFSECTLTCKCGKEFTSTFTGACFAFDYHYIKEHVL